MTFEEAKAQVAKQVKMEDVRQRTTDTRQMGPDILQALVDEIERIREFLYSRMGELP